MSMSVFKRPVFERKWLINVIKIKRVYQGVFCLLLIISSQSTWASMPVQQFILNGAQYQIEIAQSSEQLKKGLMGRKFLAKNKGMLFVFPMLYRHGIWMKNMSISLKVAWLDEHYKVVDVQTLTPCIKSPCTVFRPKQPARFVLELNVDDKVKVGDQLYSHSFL